MKRIDRSLSYSNFLAENAENPTVLIEITSKCNFFCDYCISPNSPREKAYMGMDLYTHILDQMAGFTPYPLRLHIDGEPTTHPLFREMAIMANERGHDIQLATNGSALQEKFLDITSVSMRIHLSVSAEELVTRSKMKFQAYLEKMQNYIRAWADSDSPQNISLNVYLEPTVFKNKSVRREKAEFMADFLTVAGVYIEGSDIWDYSFRKELGGILSVGLMEIAHGAIHGGGSQNVLMSQRGFCDSPWKTLAILQDGSLSYCCNDLSGATAFTQPEEIYQQSIQDLWLKHPNIVRIREETLGAITNNTTCQKCISSYGNRKRELFMGWGKQFDGKIV